MSAGGFVVHDKTFGRILSIKDDDVTLYPLDGPVKKNTITYVEEIDTTPHAMFYFYMKNEEMKPLLKPIIELYLLPTKLTQDQITKKALLHFFLKKDVVTSKDCREDIWKELQKWVRGTFTPPYTPPNVDKMDYKLTGRKTEQVKQLCAILVKNQCDTLDENEQKIICILNDTCVDDLFSDPDIDVPDDSGLVVPSVSDNSDYITHVMSFANALLV